jgi:hypothetical protein
VDLDPSFGERACGEAQYEATIPREYLPAIVAATRYMYLSTYPVGRMLGVA